jgi:colanic acid biosynthesis glycosyl transferase WcaI
MRIVVHDYSGHAFPVQLSRWLASCGHDVLHLYSADIESPRGRLALAQDDPPTLTIEAVSVGRAVPKYSLVQRYLQEQGFAARLSRRIRAFAPEAIISGNAPINIQQRLRKDFRDLPFVFWVQDIYSIALRHYLGRKLPLGARAIAAWFGHVEFGTMRRSDGVIVITEDFRTILCNHGVADARIATIPNWAPLAELPEHPRDNAWAREAGLVGRFIYLYSGTLGLKHDPGCLVDLARSLSDDDGAAVVVISQGLGRRMLEEARAQHGLANLHLLDYQPFERVPEVLASADVLLALLEPEASALSVPSKVLTYLTAGRAILGMIPPENQAAQMVVSAGAGIMVPPGDKKRFVEEAHRMRLQTEECRAMGRAARRYAEATFDMDRIGRGFLEVLHDARQRRS